MFSSTISEDDRHGAGWGCSGGRSRGGPAGESGVGTGGAGQRSAGSVLSLPKGGGSLMRLVRRFHPTRLLGPKISLFLSPLAWVCEYCAGTFSSIYCRKWQWAFSISLGSFDSSDQSKTVKGISQYFSSIGC